MNVGDVWLYNRCPTPDTAEWTDREHIPFANHSELVGEGGHVERKVQRNDVFVDWEYADDIPVAYVYIFDDLFAIVG